MKRIFQILIVLFFSLNSCGGDSHVYEPIEFPSNQENTDETPALSDEELLDLTQKETFKYFWDFAENNSGAAKERYHPNNPTLNQNVVTTGGTGFGLMSILVGIERGFITREEGFNKLQKILNF